MNSHGLFISLLVLLIWAPLPHGGERFWEVGPIAVGSFLILGIWSFRQWRSNTPLPFIIIDNMLPLILLVIWLIYNLIQAIPLPFTWLSFLNPNIDTIYSFANFENTSRSSSLSIDPYSTLITLIKNTSYICLFFLTLVLCDTIKRLKTIALTLFFTGFALSFYSLLNHYSSGAFSLNESLPPWVAHWSKSTRGTFSNQNHFAAMLEMTIPIAIAVLMSISRTRRPDNSWKYLVSYLIDYLMSIRAIYILMILIMLLALIETASRGANAAFIIGLILSVFVFNLSNNTKLVNKTLYVLIVPVIFFVFTSSDDYNLFSRIKNSGFNSNGRDVIRSTTYNLIGDYPVFGSGSGTYFLIHSKYRNPILGTNPQLKHAHNDYLELLATQGFIGFSIFSVSIFIFILNILKAIRIRRDLFMRSLLFGTFFGIVSVLIHAFFELHFQIPAIAMYFFVLLALGVIASKKNIRQ
jgi:O-antigen ligase